jgi:hypothetical protein
VSLFIEEHSFRFETLQLALGSGDVATETYGAFGVDDAVPGDSSVFWVRARSEGGQRPAHLPGKPRRTHDRADVTVGCDVSGWHGADRSIDSRVEGLRAVSWVDSHAGQLRGVLFSELDCDRVGCGLSTGLDFCLEDVQ